MFIVVLCFYLHYICLSVTFVFALCLCLHCVCVKFVLALCICIVFVHIVMEDILDPVLGEKLPSHIKVDGQCYYIWYLPGVKGRQVYIQVGEAKKCE